VRQRGFHIKLCQVKGNEKYPMTSRCLPSSHCLIHARISHTHRLRPNRLRFVRMKSC